MILRIQNNPFWLDVLPSRSRWNKGLTFQTLGQKFHLVAPLWGCGGWSCPWSFARAGWDPQVALGNPIPRALSRGYLSFQKWGDSLLLKPRGWPCWSLNCLQDYYSLVSKNNAYSWSNISSVSSCKIPEVQPSDRPSSFLSFLLSSNW